MMKHRRGSAIGQWIIAFTGLIGAAVALMPLITNVHNGKVKMMADGFGTVGKDAKIGDVLLKDIASLTSKSIKLDSSGLYNNHMAESDGKSYQESEDKKYVSSGDLTVSNRQLQVRLPGAKQIQTGALKNGVAVRTDQENLWK